MSGEPNYYELLGIEPTADQAAIDAAYQGRSLRFRLGQLRDRARSLPGPSQEEVEQAYAVLGNPEARALYDAAYFPDKAQPRRRLPAWLWAVAGFWVVAITIVCVLGARSRLADDGGAIGQFVSTATVTNSPSVVAAAVTETLAPTATPTIVAPINTPQQVAVPTATTTATAAPTPTPTTGTPGTTFRPTETSEPAPSSAPSATATVVVPSAAPTATLEAPTATAEPSPPTPEPPPPPPTELPPPPPTPTPSFRATDRIGTQVRVNLRAGPGTGFASLGALSPGTLLRATGETAYSGGYLWRRFTLADGRTGWVRDIDVFTVR